MEKILARESGPTERDGRLKYVDPEEIQKHIRVDAGRKFEDTEDLNVEYSQTQAGPKSIDPSSDDIRIIKNHINEVLRSDQKKLKTRFLSFLKCNSMVNIAKMANVKKQAIQKQFYGVIKKIHSKMSSGKINAAKTITPYQFKLKLS